MTLGGALRSLLLGAALASAASGCSGSLESLGSGNTGTPSSLQPVTHSGGYYNAFESLLGKQDSEVQARLEAAFQQLFHSTDDTEYIFFEHQAEGNPACMNPGAPCSLIYDFLHRDVRTEGIGLAMLIAVELDHQQEFDELWRYSKAVLLETEGPAKGYFNSHCGEDVAAPCFDVYGMQHFVLALMLANGRWRSSADMPYESDALTLLDALKNKELENGGVVKGIGNAFSSKDFLVREEPSLADAGFSTRSSLQMPAAYWYWAQATGDPFWNSAAQASHAFLLNAAAKAADPPTGLAPMRSYFDGTPVEGSDGYTEQGYRTQLNLALDALWGSASADQAALATRLLKFFYDQGITTYGRSFQTDGTPIETKPAQALAAVNGALAVAAPAYEHRAEFVQAVWDQTTPTGDNRYYVGLMYLTSLLILSGQLQVY